MVPPASFYTSTSVRWKLRHKQRHNHVASIFTSKNSKALANTQGLWKCMCKRVRWTYLCVFYKEGSKSCFNQVKKSSLSTLHTHPSQTRKSYTVMHCYKHHEKNSPWWWTAGQLTRFWSRATVLVLQAPYGTSVRFWLEICFLITSRPTYQRYPVQLHSRAQIWQADRLGVLRWLHRSFRVQPGVPSPGIQSHQVPCRP